MTYFDLLAWHVENQTKLEGCRIDNIYAGKGAENLFLFHLHCRDGDRDLIMEPGRRIHFTKFTLDRETNGQISFLRSLLRESFIRETNLLDGERIYLLNTSNGKKIILELLPRGILLLTDENNQILFSSQTRQFKDRKIRQGETYTPPPQVNPRKPSLTSILGAPTEIIEALNIKDTENGKILIENLRENLRKGQIYPCLKQDTVLPIKVDGCVEASSFNEALDSYFTRLEKEEIVNKASEKLNSEKGRLTATINEINEKINEYRSKAEKLRSIGKKIMESYSDIEKIVQMSGGKKNKINVTLDGIEIGIDPLLSPTKNATRYFDEAKEYEAKAKKAEETIINLKEKLKNLELSIKQKEESRRVKIREKEWYEKYRWTITRNGLLVIAGRDVDQNESLVRKLLDDNDIFLHADIHGAPATIIKSNGKEITEEDIHDASVLSAAYSKAWKEGLGSVDVFWVPGKQVSKSPPSGEYLTKGSFMIYGKKNFLKNVKLELWFGFEESEGIRVFVGSKESVKMRSKFTIRAIPGDEDPEKVAAKIIKVISREGLEISGLKDEIMRALPGKSKIVRENA